MADSNAIRRTVDDPHPFVVELVWALRDLDGLDRLDPCRLAGLVTAADLFPGDLGTFRAELAFAWSLAEREPTDIELADLEAVDAGLIDWGDADGGPLPHLDVLPGVDPESPLALAERERFWDRMATTRAELDALADDEANAETAYDEIDRAIALNRRAVA